MAVAARVRHFVSIADLSSGELVALLDHGAAMKAGTAGRDAPLRGMALAQIFEKPSLRTRLSFDVAMAELGGHSSYLSPQEVGLGRRESVAEEFARYASVPVINGLSDLSHPCQGLADIFTIRERKGLDGTITAYVGDGNNVLHSLMLCVAKTGATLRIATPEGYGPQERFLTLARAVEKESGARIELTDDPVAAVTGADVVYTDVWTSMGQEQEYERRRRAFQGYQVNAKLVAHAKPDAIVMHDMPAHRGEEITDEVLDGPRSVVLDQAENKMHMLKAVLCWLVGGTASPRPPLR